MTSLRPCPFCGSTDVSQKGEVPDGYDRWQSYVECGSCHVRTDYHDDIGTAEAVWNRRASQ